MKNFLSISFNPVQCRQELEEFNQLLESKADLEENRDIKPFFESHHQAAVLMGGLSPHLVRTDLLAFQYPLFGDFACDLVVGDSLHHTFGFVELEAASANCIFRRQGRKATPEWASCFEHGNSQLTDWLWKLDDMANTDDFEVRFGKRRTSFFGLLVVGRSSELASPREQQRWDWRRTKVIVNSLQLFHLTYDELAEDLEKALIRHFLWAQQQP